ncbi:MAG: fumarylacetoacetate hydrolase family protein [Pseudomonadota bacterium]|nr:fumarylacetoacetate hydrolase family protein [Pseudomonadota bacterium]
MPDAAVDSVIAALLRARRAGRAVETIAHAPLLASAEQAYAVQAGVARELHWFDDGPPMHWKSGGPSRIAPLTHAPLPPAGIWNSPAAAGDWPFNQRGIEAEVALRLGTAVDAATAASIDEARASKLIDAMCVSIEVVDSRWSEGLSAPALLRLADLQSHGALVLGDWAAYAPRDWTRQVCRVAIDGRVVVERKGTHAFGSVVWGLGPWLRHATRDGAVVPAGCVVTTGTWVGIVDAAAGNKVAVEFDGIGSAEIQL